MVLRDFFERVYVINLRRRPDRLRAFFERLRKYGWPFREPVVYPAIDGDTVGVPVEFTQGGGAYGCRMSHLRILQDCLMEDVQSVLILEDDADITSGFPAAVETFLAKLPEDWEGVMLGGQHHAPPIHTDIPGLVRVRYAQRTHAYGARRSYMKALQRRWGNCTVHIDWVMKDWHHRHVVYAPDPWLIGQAGGRSDIRGAEKPAEWWIDGLNLPPTPVAIADVPASACEKMRELGFHFGMELTEEGVDASLQRMLSAGLPEEELVINLRFWLEKLQAESIGGLMPCIWHPRIRLEEAVVRKAWTGPVYVVSGNTADEALACLPEDIRLRMRERISLRIAPIVLLHCPSHLVELLHANGFHPGYWRDRETGIDMGLKHIFSKESPEKWATLLADWCSVLCKEGDRDGLVVVARHPQLTVELLRQATARSVFEISAMTIDELRKRFNAMIGWQSPPAEKTGVSAGESTTKSALL